MMRIDRGRVDGEKNERDRMDKEEGRYEKRRHCPFKTSLLIPAPDVVQLSGVKNRHPKSGLAGDVF